MADSVGAQIVGGVIGIGFGLVIVFIGLKRRWRWFR